MGAGSALILLLSFGRLGDLGWRLFLIAIGLGAGWLWGHLIWHFWAAPYFGLSKKDDDR